MTFDWLNKESREFLSRGYLLPGQTPEARIRQIADAAENYLGIDGYADKFYDYMSRGFYSLSSPVWSNYGRKDRGLPVSCFGSYLGDNMESILYTVAENGMLMKGGGGTSGYFGALRPRGAPIKDNGESSGSVHFMKLFDSLADVVSQGSVRRGFFSAYLPIDHPDAEEFLDIGTEGHPIQGLTTGITVSDDFLNQMIAGDDDKRKLWAKVLQTRSEIGFPYIMFEGNSNKSKPDVYHDNNMPILASQMCLTGDTKIRIKYNNEEITETLASFDQKFQMGFYSNTVYVWSMNIETGKDEWKEILNSAETDQVDELYIIECNGNKIQCTGNHLLYTKNRGYVRADELEESDELVMLTP